MLNATGIDHASIVVTDLERSRAFYRGVLQLAEIPPPTTFEFVVLWFRVGRQTVHLIQKPEAEPISPRHFALQVRDAAAARSHCRQFGVAIEETIVIPGADRFFIRDPDGNRIELIQWIKPYLQ